MLQRRMLLLRLCAMRVLGLLHRMHLSGLGPSRHGQMPRWPCLLRLCTAGPEINYRNRAITGARRSAIYPRPLRAERGKTAAGEEPCVRDDGEPIGT